MPDIKDVATEVLDVGQVDKIVRHRGWEVEVDERLTQRNQSRQEGLPEELMVTLADEIGDGLAKVTVGSELAHSKEYGCKAQAFVSISVHCNNDDSTIERVQSHLHAMTRKLAVQDLEEMITDRDRFLHDPGGRLARGGDRPATKSLTPTAGVSPKIKARPRPSYKR